MIDRLFMMIFVLEMMIDAQRGQPGEQAPLTRPKFSYYTVCYVVMAVLLSN